MKMVLKKTVTTDKQRARSFVCNSHKINELQDAENLTSGEKGAIIVV